MWSVDEIFFRLRKRFNINHSPQRLVLPNWRIHEYLSSIWQNWVSERYLGKIETILRQKMKLEQTFKFRLGFIIASLSRLDFILSLLIDIFICIISYYFLEIRICDKFHPTCRSVKMSVNIKLYFEKLRKRKETSKYRYRKS